MSDRGKSVSQRNLHSGTSASTSATLNPTNTANLPTPASTAESAYDAIRSGVPSGHRRMTSAPVTPVVQAQTISRSDAGLQSPIGKADKSGAQKKLHLTLLPAVSAQGSGAAPSTTPRKPAHGVPVLPMAPSSARGAADSVSPFSGSKGAQHSPASPRPSEPPSDLPPQLPAYVPPPSDAPPPLSPPRSQGKPDSLSVGMGASTGGIVSGTKASDDDSLAAQIEQMADDVVAAELDDMKLRMGTSAMWGMVGKEEKRWNGKSVYPPIRQFLASECRAVEHLIGEIRKQTRRLDEDYGHDPNALQQTSGGNLSGVKKTVDLELTAPYVKPILDVVCGERLDYRDCGLSQRTKALLETIDRKLHAKLLQNDNVSLGDIEKIRGNLFKAILFTRGISPLLQSPNGEDYKAMGKDVPTLLKDLSGALNRSFNLNYKDFVKSFVRHGNRNLPEEAKKLYEAKQDKVKAKRRQELTGTIKRSKNSKARSQPMLPQGDEFLKAMEKEGRRHKKEVDGGKGGESRETLEKTVVFYRNLYANTKGWSADQVKHFKMSFDEHAKSWMKKHGDGGDIVALETELKAVFKAYKTQLTNADSDGMPSSSSSTPSTPSTPSTSTGKRKNDPSTSNAPISPRGKARDDYGIAATARRRKQREESYARNLSDFLARPDCADDFADEGFKGGFVAAAWEAFDPDQSAKDGPAMLNRIFEAELIVHFKHHRIPVTLHEAHAGKHPRMKQLDASIAAWKEAQGDNGRILNGEVLSSLWMRLENEATTIATFKTVVSNQDKSAIGHFASFDAAIQRWRKVPANAQKPLTEKVLQKLWLEESPQKSPASAESGRGAPQSPLSNEAERRAAQERARERMRDQLKEFRNDPANTDFAKAGFERAFLDSAIQLKSTDGLAALKPENLKRLYTETQIQRY